MNVMSKEIFSKIENETVIQSNKIKEIERNTINLFHDMKFVLLKLIEQKLKFSKDYSFSRISDEELIVNSLKLLGFESLGLDTGLYFDNNFRFYKSESLYLFKDIDSNYLEILIIEFLKRTTTFSKIEYNNMQITGIVDRFAYEIRAG